MNRSALRKTSAVRLRDSRSLLRAGRYSAAYYLLGYAVECAIKACVARKVKRYDFPDKKLANKAHTHDLEQLVGVAGLEADFAAARLANPELDVNWAVVKDWVVDSRYDTSISEAQARDMYSACTARRNGVLPWIKERW